MDRRFKRRVLASLLVPALYLPLAALAAGEQASAAGGSGGSAQPASRPAQAPSGTDAVFDRLDSNHDGKLSKDEARSEAGMIDMWQRLDTDNDGLVSRAEFDAQHGSLAAGDANVGVAVVTTAVVPATPRAGASAGGQDIRADKLIGMHVRNPQGQDLGEIKDLVVDTQQGKVRYAVLSFGGFLDIGDKLFAYPLSAFSRGPGGDVLVLDVDKQKLENAPGFERKRWMDWNDRGYLSRVDRYFAPDGQAGAANRMVSARRLMGRDVHDRTGDDIGEIKDLVVDLDNGSVSYAVLEYDKPWSLDNPRFAVPLASFDFSNPRDTRLDLDRDRIERAVSGGSTRTTARAKPAVQVEHYAIVLVPEQSSQTTAQGGSTPGASSAATAGSSGATTATSGATTATSGATASSGDHARTAADNTANATGGMNARGATSATTASESTEATNAASSTGSTGAATQQDTMRNGSSSSTSRPQ